MTIPNFNIPRTLIKFSALRHFLPERVSEDTSLLLLVPGHAQVFFTGEDSVLHSVSVLSVFP
jgi:hypothetical protein